MAPIDPQREQQVMEILEGALDRSDPERPAWLQQACGGDTALLREVTEALAWEQRMGGFMQKPVLALTDPGPGEGPGAQIGPYTLVRQLGEGGMGVIYQARQTQPIRREVALKIVKPGMDSRQVIARFESERQALAMMDHPNIARVIEAGTTPAGRPYFVMDLVDGVPITQYCDTHRLPPRRRLELMIPVCQAIHHAHQKGIIHRDIKPSNILVEERDGQPVPKVIDFGIAKATEQSLTDATAHTQLGAIVGTPEYMSPEQADLAEHNIDTRSDIYSLGALLYKLLAGVTPIEGTDGYLEMLRALREVEPRPPSARVGNTAEVKLLRGELDWIVMKALEKDRNRRYETAAALARDLQRYLDGEPVEAGAPSTTYLLRKFAHRYRVWLGVAAAFLVIVAAAAAFSIRAAITATRARQETQAVNDFLQSDLLSQASADAQAQAGNRPEPDLKVKTVLDRAAAKVGAKFALQPVVEASIRHTIGDAYLNLGLYPEAQANLERALDLRRRVLGNSHLETLRTMNRLGFVFAKSGQFPKADQLLREAVASGRRTLGPEHPQTLACMLNLASNLMNQGKYSESEALFKQVVEADRRVLGEDNRNTLTTMGNLAILYMRETKYAEAEALYLKAVDGFRRTEGEDAPNTLMYSGNLVSVYVWMGKPDQAEDLDARILAVQRRLLGPDHPATLVTMNNLAVAQRAQGKYAQAEGLLHQVIEAQTRLQGPEHASTLETMDSLALVYSMSGRTAEAEAMHEKILSARRRVLGEDHPSTLLTMNTLSDLYLAEGKYRQAEGLMRISAPLSDKKIPKQWRRFQAHSLLGRSLAMQGQFAEAEPLLLSGYEGMMQRQATVPPFNPRRERQSMERAGTWIVDLYRDWGKPDKAAGWQAKLMAGNSAPKP